MSSVFIFNQYYIDLLKRIKSKCKENKDENSKRILKHIKETYATLDKSSSEYISFVNEEISQDKWADFLVNDNWLSENTSVNIYKQISIGDFMEILDDEYLHLHFLTIFYIFQQTIEDDVNELIVNSLQKQDFDLIKDIDNENIKTAIQKLFNYRNEKIKEKSGMDMKFIEDTTLGKLAKEIMEDIDVSKIQKSIGENGDVLKAIGNPDSGFADIITSVSQKMANKISNGELKQENIIQDAMKFASSMPGMMGEGGGNKGGQPDMANMMNMMSSLMGGEAGMQDMFKNMMGNQKKTKGGGGGRPVFNESAYKKMAYAKKMKKKLSERKKTQEN